MLDLAYVTYALAIFSYVIRRFGTIHFWSTAQTKPKQEVVEQNKQIISILEILWNAMHPVAGSARLLLCPTALLIFYNPTMTHIFVVCHHSRSSRILSLSFSIPSTLKSSSWLLLLLLVGVAIVVFILVVIIVVPLLLHLYGPSLIHAKQGRSAKPI